MPASLAATHANYSPDFWTPPEWLGWVSATFGTGDWFDPCPGDWSPDEPSGLDIAWRDRCYVNHPGARASTAQWWTKYLRERGRVERFIWCAFSVEQLRHQLPSALELAGWLVAPRTRTAFIWGGPDMPATATRAERKHGQPLTQPGNWAVWWTTVDPAPPPVECIITRTGGGR